MDDGWLKNTKQPTVGCNNTTNRIRFLKLHEVAYRFQIYSENIPVHLSAFGKRPFLGPTDHTLWPFPGAIAWHQQTRFRSR
jgi:hypothetical protein